jgi:hypothetical protein
MGGPGVVPTFLFYFVGATFIVVFVLSEGLKGVEIGNPYAIAIWFGVAAGAMGAYFNSHQSISTHIHNRSAFFKSLLDSLTQMGYAETAQIDNLTIYERPMPGRFLSGSLLVQVEDNTATIAGRSSIIRGLRKRMKI